MVPGDLLLFTDWRGDPDQRLDGPATEVSARSVAPPLGVIVKGWSGGRTWTASPSASRRTVTSARRSTPPGGRCLRDMRVRPGGSHHQKFVVLRHPGRPELDVAFVGGIDLCHSRPTTRTTAATPRRQPMAQVYGTRPPWHDVQLAHPRPSSRRRRDRLPGTLGRPGAAQPQPHRPAADRFTRALVATGPLPARLPDPAPCGRHTVQLLRTYPHRRRGYPFAPRGERSIARGYQKAVARPAA